MFRSCKLNYVFVPVAFHFLPINREHVMQRKDTESTLLTIITSFSLATFSSILSFPFISSYFTTRYQHDCFYKKFTLLLGRLSMLIILISLLNIAMYIFIIIVLILLLYAPVIEN